MKPPAYVTVNGCNHCGARWNLNEKLEETGMVLPAAMGVFIAALNSVSDRLQYEHGKCKAPGVEK